MEEKINQSPGLHGILLVTLLLTLPIAWSQPVKKPSSGSDATPAGPVGPGACPSHLIPEDPSQLKSWFSKIIKPPKERKDIEPDIVTAEDKFEIMKVRKDGSGKFKTIMEAVNTVEVRGNDNRVIIDIGPGVYHEKIIIDRYRPYITLYGNPKDKPTLLFDANTAKFEVTETATLTVEGDNFIGVNLNIINSTPRPDAANGEAYGLALRVMGDSAAFYNCKFLGFKNTVLDDKGRHFFKDCYIEGTDDIIFGDGRTLYLQTIVSVLPSEPTSIITAQARKNTDESGGGFVFAYCNIIGVSRKILLGRTYMAGSRVIYAYSNLGPNVEPKGWSDDFLTDYEKTGFFAEYKNIGLGAGTGGRIKLPCLKELTPADVKAFLTLDYIDAAEWLLPPPTITPTSGL